MFSSGTSSLNSPSSFVIDRVSQLEVFAITVTARTDSFLGVTTTPEIFRVSGARMGEVQTEYENNRTKSLNILTSNPMVLRVLRDLNTIWMLIVKNI